MNKVDGDIYRKTYKMIGLFLLVCSLGFGALIFIPIKQWQAANLTYAECIYQEYQFQSLEIIKGKNRHYHLYVSGEDKPLFVSSIEYDLLKQNGIEQLKTNTIIYVYLLEYEHDDYLYKVVEITSETENFLILSDYIQKEKTNAMIGFILLPVLVLAGSLSGLVLLIKKFPTDFRY